VHNVQLATCDTRKLIHTVGKRAKIGRHVCVPTLVLPLAGNQSMNRRQALITIKKSARPCFHRKHDDLRNVDAVSDALGVRLF
jgi:hypothetical protein